MSTGIFNDYVISGAPADPIIIKSRVSHLLEQTADRNPHALALISKWEPIWNPMDGVDGQAAEDCLHWSYGSLKRTATALSRRWRDAGLIPGNAACIISSTCVQWVVSLWAALIGDFTFVPLDPSLASRADDLKQILAQIEPSFVIVQDETQAKAIDDTMRLTEKKCLKSIMDHNNTMGALSDGSDWLPFSSMLNPTHDETSLQPTGGGKVYPGAVIICHTSGTTSQPKACPLSDRNLAASLSALRDTLRFGPTDRSLHHAPGYSMMSLIMLLQVWSTGGSIIFPSKVFDPISILNAIDEEACTVFSTVPPVVRVLALVPRPRPLDTTSLRIVVLGGAMVTPEAVQLCFDGLKPQSVGFGWGMTEAGALLVGKPVQKDAAFDQNSLAMYVGAAAVQIKVCSPGSTTPLQPGRVGEMHICGPSVINGYVGNHQDPFYSHEGSKWMRTGDLAIINTAGAVSIEGRLKDLIIRGGVNLSPAKIVAPLNSIPGIEVQVVGVPDQVAGEVPVAVILDRRPLPSAQSAGFSKGVVSQLQDLALMRLNTSMIPAAWISLANDLKLPNFPTTPAGKPKKAALAALVKQFLDASGTDVPIDAAAKHIEDILTLIWSRVVGLDPESIDKHVTMTNHADSISILRFSSGVRQSLHRSITAREILENPSIIEQASLVNGREVLPFSRTSPGSSPTAKDMAHCEGSEETAAATRKSLQTFFSALNMSWSDVEHVIPAVSYGPSARNRRLTILSQRSVIKLQEAWQGIVSHHPMLRAVFSQVPQSSGPSTSDQARQQHVFAVSKDTKEWWAHTVTGGYTVDSPAELDGVSVNDSDDGILTKATFVHVTSTNQSAMILMISQAVFDNTYADMVLHGLTFALEQDSSSRAVLSTPAHVPYKLYADHYFRYRNSPSAIRLAAFHLERFQGAQNLKQSLWPAQEASRSNQDSFRQYAEIITKTSSAPALQECKSQHSIEPNTFTKAAVALFNMVETKTRTALFATINANRTWPFVEECTAEEAQNTALNPIDIAGPLVQYTPDRVDLRDSPETVKAFVTRVEAEQTALTANAAATLSSVLGDLGPADSAVVQQIMRRQWYNWAPFSQFASQVQRGPNLELHSYYYSNDTQICWDAGLSDRSSFYLKASYDDRSFSAADIERAVDRVLRIAVWLTEAINSENNVEDVFQILTD